MGRIARVDDEPVFLAEWEGRVFGLVLVMLCTGLMPRVDQFRHRLESIPPATYLATSYYARQLLAVEAVLVAGGVLSREAIDRASGSDRRVVRPSNNEEGRKDIVKRAVIGGPTGRTLDRPPRFAVGDRVRASDVAPRGHTRLARYVRGHVGVVERCYAAYALPERAAEGEVTFDYVYAVRFDATELWGASAEPNVTVCIDLFGTYLAAA